MADIPPADLTRSADRYNDATRPFTDLVRDRAARDPEFRQALADEGIDATRAPAITDSSGCVYRDLGQPCATPGCRVCDATRQHHPDCSYWAEQRSADCDCGTVRRATDCPDCRGRGYTEALSGYQLRCSCTYAPTPLDDAHHEPGAPGSQRDAAGRATTCWARTWRRAEISIAEADAQRDMRDRCIAEVKLQAKLLRDCQGNSAYALALDALADVLASLKPRATETGLDARGA